MLCEFVLTYTMVKAGEAMQRTKFLDDYAARVLVLRLMSVPEDDAKYSVQDIRLTQYKEPFDCDIGPLPKAIITKRYTAR
jgi:hypothetical protein